MDEGGAHEAKRPRLNEASPVTCAGPSATASAAAAPKTLLVLCGIPGAGKSTFAHALAQRSALSWVRVNQDTVRNGARGTREQCLAALAAALDAGGNAIIDRTNATPDQRQPFLQKAREKGAERAFCVAFRLPVKVCGERAAARQGHEGGVQGPRAYAAVGMVNKQLAEAGNPKESEGFDAVLVCETDAEVEAALETLAAYGPQCLDLAAEWAKRRPPPAKKPETQTIDEFFTKKAAAPAKAAPESPERPSLDAFDVMMQASKKQGSTEKSAAAALPSPPAKGPVPAGGSRHSFGASPFLDALLSYARTPERLAATDSAVRFDAHCVVVPDKFPKAALHGLVVARDPRLQGPLDLTMTPENLDLVRHMKAVGQRWAEEHAPGLPVALGFHSAPSMRQLHLHVISKDYDSPSLKTKKHWNSFTTPFFLDVDWVLGQLEAEAGGSGGGPGHLEYNVAAKEALLKGPLVCHRCKALCSNMPKLKDHIKACSK